MTEHKIDNVALTYPPAHTQIIEPIPIAYPGPGLGKVVVQPRTPPIIEWRWGMDVQLKEVVADLIDKRGQRVCHMISWTDEIDSRLKHRNVIIPPIGAGYGPQRNWVDTFTLRMEEIRPMPSLAVVELTASGTLTVGDSKAKWDADAGGRILTIGGFIETLGTGAGGTTVQVSNGVTDYLSTKADFLVATGTGLMENAVLVSSPTFDRGDVIELDIDAIPGNSDSADVHILLYCLIFAV